MDTSPGAAISISLALAIVLSACPVAGAFSFPAGWAAATDLIAGGPGLQDKGAQPRVRAIDESFNGKTVHVASGDTLLVHLNERNPDQTWHFRGDDSFKVISDVVLEMYPARHDFRVRVYRPGDLRFNKVDRRDGFVIDTFTVRVVLDKDKPDDDSLPSYPLRMLHTIGPGMNEFPFWQ
jgi:hypothetical protein